MNKKKALFEKVIGSGGYKEVSDVRPTYDGSKDRSDRHHKSRKKERKKYSRRHDDRHRHRHRSDDKYVSKEISILTRFSLFSRRSFSKLVCIFR